PFLQHSSTALSPGDPLGKYSTLIDFNPAKGDTKAPDCKYVITSYSNNIFGPGIPNVFPGPGLFPGQSLNQNEVNNTGAAGLPSGQNLNANQPNIAGLTGLLSGQNLNANQPNIAGPMAAHTSSGKTIVMGKG
ncbi:MAG: hypothetical protein WBZ36_00040, partial [Candidatus Nitrosopolaris sp.]